MRDMRLAESGTGRIWDHHTEYKYMAVTWVIMFYLYRCVYFCVCACVCVVSYDNITIAMTILIVIVVLVTTGSHHYHYVSRLYVE